MRGARNLNLREAMGARIRAEGAIIFSCRPNMDIIQLMCASKRCSGVQEQSPWSGEYEGWQSPPKAETLLAFGGSLKAANLPVFNI